MLVSLRAFALVLMAALVAPLLPAPAAAQSAEGQIQLVVVDAATTNPIGDARTFLLGAQTANALTTASGKIDFTDVPVGIYRIRVQARGYDGAGTREFDVLADRSVHVRIELSKRSASSSTAAGSSAGGNSSSLKVIGHVTARSSISIMTTSIDADSPIRRLSDSLTSALDKLAGVSVTTDSTDPTSAVQISLHNQDESQTALTMDGIPLSGPGSAGNVRAIGTDLFSGSSVSFAPSAGGLAGGVNFSTLQPTQALQVRAAGTTGTFDRSNYSLATTGSFDRVGFVLEHTWRGANSPLTFDDYLDQSGLDYAHEGESTSLSDLVKLRYTLGDERTSITATALDTNRNADAICAQDVTILPCGIGPNNRTYGRYGMAYTTIQSLVGDVQTNLSLYANSSTTTTDDLDRFVLAANPSLSGQPSGSGSFEPALDPSLTIANTVTRGIAYSASIAQGHHTLSFVGNTYAATASSDPVVGSQFQVPYTNAAASSRYQFNDAIKSNDHLTLTPSVSLANTSGLGDSILGGMRAAWTPKTADAYSLALDVGSSQPNLSATRSFSDPISARFNCEAESAVVSGPGDTGDGQRQSAASITAAWAHQFAGGSTLSVDAYSQVQSGQLISALIDEPLSYYAGAGFGYLQAVYDAYRAAGVCGAPAATPTVYAQESVAGTRRLYQGFDVTARLALSRYVELLPTYSTNLAVLTAAGPRLSDGPSTTLVGAQLPNRPMHRGGLTVDALLPRSGLELLANAQYTGANNQQNLGPYVNVSFGASHKLGPGEITLFENNAFNTYAGDFATDAYAAPIPLSNGTPFLASATPLLPRTIFLSYSAAVGGPAPGPAFGRFARPSQLAAAQATPPPAASGGPPRPQRFTSNPPPPGVDPLSLATARSTCGADAQAAAQPLFDALRAYVSAVEHGTKPLPTVPDMTVEVVKTTADTYISYYLTLHPNLPRPPGAPGAGAPRVRGGDGPGAFGPPGGGPPPSGGPPQDGAVVAQSAPATPRTPEEAAARRAFLDSPAVKAYRAFIGCAYVTIVPAADAKAKGIAQTGGRPGIFYVPGVGITFVQTAQLPQGGGSLRTAPGAAAPVPAPSAGSPTPPVPTPSSPTPGLPAPH